jgi:hypothetical protein
MKKSATRDSTQMIYWGAAGMPGETEKAVKTLQQATQCTRQELKLIQDQKHYHMIPRFIKQVSFNKDLYNDICQVHYSDYITSGTDLFN